MMVLWILFKTVAGAEEQNSPTASVGSVNHDPSDQFQDAQDPYSGYDLDKI